MPVLDVRDADRFTVFDQDLLHAGVVDKLCPSLERLRNLSDRRAHQRIVFTRYAGIQPVAAEDAAVPVGSGNVRGNAQIGAGLPVKNAGFIPVFRPVAVYVQDGFGLLVVALEGSFSPALNTGFRRKSIPVHQPGTHPRSHVHGRSATHQARFPLRAGIDLVTLDHIHGNREERFAVVEERVVRLESPQVDLGREFSRLGRAKPRFRDPDRGWPGLQNQQ